VLCRPTPLIPPHENTFTIERLESALRIPRASR
jgi:hypothetical protein